MSVRFDVGLAGPDGVGLLSAWDWGAGLLVILLSMLLVCVLLLVAPVLLLVPLALPGVVGCGALVLLAPWM